MKETFRKLGLSLILSGIICSCASDITRNVEEILPGKTPIVFSIGTKKSSTRLTNGTFTAGDRMGLYATVGNEGIDGSRYIENIQMTSIDGEKVALEQDIFYPVGGHKLNFWSYYPYRSKALTKGGTSIEVSVKTDQQTEEGISQSDFMTSQVKQVAESENAVALNFVHRLTKIELSLKPATGNDAISLLEKGISATAINFYTTAEYDFSTGQIKNPKNKQDIRTFGRWKVENSSIVGGHFLIVPQQADKQKLIIDIGGSQQLIEPDFDDSYETGKAINIQISLDKDSPAYLKGIVTSIKDWEEGNPIQGEGTHLQNALHLAAFDFEKFKIHHIYRNGIPVGEICREYLYIPDQLDLQAIVYYPMTEWRADLSRGTVLKVLGKERENVHRGSVSWDMGTGIPTYTPGQGTALEIFGMKESGDLTTEEDGVPVNVMAYTIADKRGNTDRNYPVVKIGTQHWLSDDLNTTKYTDGVSMKRLDDPNGQPGYLTYTSNSASYIYYTGELLLDTRIAPAGCRIPTKSDWNRLIQYVGEMNAGVLKSGGWEPYNEAEVEVAMNNKTGLNVRPQGYFLNKATAPAGLDQNTYYWIGGDTPGTYSADSTAVCFSYRNNKILSNAKGWSSKGNGFHALSIRCLVDK